MKRVLLAGAWLAYSVWWCWRTRPVEWPMLPMQAAQAMPDNFSHLYPDDLTRIQAVVDAGVPVISLGAKVYTIDGGTIHLKGGKYRIGTRIYGGTIRYSGRYAIRISGWEEDN